MFAVLALQIAAERH